MTAFNALKRGGGQIILSLDELPAEDVSTAAQEVSPAEIYDLQCARNILQTALKSLKREMAGARQRVSVL